MPALVPSGHALSVLLVDDDPSVVDLTSTYLRAAGYRVVSAGNGRDALGVAQGLGEPIDVMVIDVMLPGMSGPVLAGAMRKLHPESAVLFTSGYSPELVAEISAPHTTNAIVLRKPFRRDELLAKIALALTRRPRQPERTARAEDAVEDPPESVPTTRR
jgi:two-component system, cell cycle sensor histidine kinase and response regulator CckA